MTQKHHVNWHQFVFSREDFDWLTKLLSTGLHAAKAQENTPEKQDLPTKVRPQVSEGMILRALHAAQKFALLDCLLVGREGVVAGRATGLVDMPLEYRKISRRHLRLTIVAGMFYLQDMNSTFVANTEGKKLVSSQSLRTWLGQRIRIANYQYVQKKLSISCLRENNDAR